MSLSEIRQKIDALDERLLALLNERAELAHEVGVEKRAQNIEIYAPEREEQVLRALSQKNRLLGGRLTEAGIRAIYREIMSAALALEKDLTIAFSGAEGSETHQAARQKFGASVRYLSQAGIPEVFAAVAGKEADYGVVPVGNTQDGPVADTLDMFIESPLRICGQVVTRMECHLLGRAPLAELRRVYLPGAWRASAQPWLAQNLPEAELSEVPDALGAAALAAGIGEIGAAAVAHRMAAEIHGLGVLVPSIQAGPEHTARYLVLGANGALRTGHDRVAVMFSVGDAPGALYHALNPFNRRQLALSKIESRPSRHRAHEYFFFVEIDGHSADRDVQEALRELGEHCPVVKILGTYPRSPKG